MREVRNSLLRRRFLVGCTQNGRTFPNLINSNMKILKNHFVFYKYKEFFYLGKRNPIPSNLSTHKVSAHYRYRKWRKGKEYTCRWRVSTETEEEREGKKKQHIQWQWQKTCIYAKGTTMPPAGR